MTSFNAETRVFYCVENVRFIYDCKLTTSLALCGDKSSDSRTEHSIRNLISSQSTVKSVTACVDVVAITT